MWLPIAKKATVPDVVNFYNKQSFQSSAKLEAFHTVRSNFRNFQIQGVRNSLEDICYPTGILYINDVMCDVTSPLNCI